MSKAGILNHERAVLFGADENLVGILNPAASAELDTERECSGEEGTISHSFAVVMLTPGMLSSAGPFRLHVELARRLAAVGVPSLRFDISGIGESLPSYTSLCSLDRTAREVSEAIDQIQRELGVSRVALFGLCSGADDAIYAALKDPRIVGVFAVDGCGYTTWRHNLRRLFCHYLPRAFQANRWLKLARKFFHNSSSPPDSLRVGDDIREFPSRAESEQQLLELTHRGVNIHMHYTGGVAHYYSYHNQFVDMFPKLLMNQYVSWSYSPNADHVAYLCEHRSDLLQFAQLKLASFGDRFCASRRLAKAVRVESVTCEGSSMVESGR